MDVYVGFRSHHDREFVSSYLIVFVTAVLISGDSVDTRPGPPGEFLGDQCAMASLIPLQFLAVWGFKDDVLFPQAADDRAAALRFEPLASFHIVTPTLARELSLALPEDAKTLVLSALESRQLLWVQS